MTVNQAIKKYKLTTVDETTAALKRRELNVDEILYMSVTKNRVAYVVRDILGVWLYTNEKSLSGSFKGTKRTKLSD